MDLDQRSPEANHPCTRFYASHYDPVQVSRRHADWLIVDHMSSTKCQQPAHVAEQQQQW